MKAGDLITAEGRAFKGNDVRVLSRDDVLVVKEIRPTMYAQGEPKKISWLVVARRVLKGGDESGAAYYVNAGNRVRKVTRGKARRRFSRLWSRVP